MGQLFRWSGGPVRTFVSLLLVVMLVACPQLCRAESLACCADRCEETGAPDDDSRAPVAPASEAVSCICAGALKDSGRLSHTPDGSQGFAHDAHSLPATPFGPDTAATAELAAVCREVTSEFPDLVPVRLHDRTRNLRPWQQGWDLLHPGTRGHRRIARAFAGHDILAR